MRHWLILVTLTIILAASSWAMLEPGIFPTHDYVHGARLAEMERAVAASHIPARWSSNFGYGYGMPLFQFYGPLPYYVGLLFYSLLNLGLAESVKILFFLSTLGTLILSYQLGKRLFASPLAGVIAAAAITLAPYRAVNIYVRGALNESWGMMGGIGVLLGITMIAQKARWGWLVFAVSIMVMATSHNLATFIFIPFILMFGLTMLALQFAKERSWNPTITALWSGALGIGLSTFYIIPSFFEKQFTQVEHFVTSGFFSYVFHFLYIRQFFQPNWGYGGSILGPDDDISFFLGYGQIVAAVLTGFFILALLMRKGTKATLAKYRDQLVIVGVSGLCVVLAVGISLQHALPIWTQFESVLAFVQFPWRYLMVIATFMGVLAAAGVVLLKGARTRLVYTAVVLGTILLNQQYFQPETINDVSEAHYYADADKIAESMSGILEDYIPAGFVKPTEPAPALAWCDASECQIQVLKNYPQERIVRVTSESENLVYLAIANYPEWRVSVDGELQDPVASESGILQATVPEGTSEIRASLHNTSLRTWSDVVSLTSLWILIAGLAFMRIKRKSS